MKEKIKNIWLWISGAILGLFGIFVLFSRIFKGAKESSEFKRERRKIEKERKDVQNKIDEKIEQKALTKKEIKDLEKKINDTSGKISDKERENAINILKNFKEKYK